MSEYHDDFTDLIGAYALDAVDPDERESIERHLHACPWCSAEVARHRETAAYLAHGGTNAPDGVWDRIVAELSPPAPPLRITLAPPTQASAEPEEGGGRSAPDTGGAVVALPERSVRMRTFVAVVAVAAALLVVAGIALAAQWGSGTEGDVAIGDQVSSTTRPSGPPAGSLEVKLAAEGSDAGAQAVVEESGRGYLVTHGLPETDEGRIYQLWGKVDGVVLSLGTFDTNTEVVNFHLDPADIAAVEAFAVTEEQAPGVVASTQQPVIAGTPT